MHRRAALSGKRFRPLPANRKSGCECTGFISMKNHRCCSREPDSRTIRPVGYNEAVGYRAGTGAGVSAAGVNRLLELPMHVMDTALFFPAYMNLKPSEARVVLNEMLANSVRFGGVLTVNWHDRSIAPERLWDQTYCELLVALRERGAWFATAGQAVSWFRKRRSARFETRGRRSDQCCGGRVR